MNVERWLKMLSVSHNMAGRKGGPAITDWNGNIISASKIDTRLHEVLIALHEDRHEFPQDTKSTEDIYDRFSVLRSLRRGSNIRALNRNVSSNDIDVFNRWKTVEVSKGKKPARSMRQHCTETSELKAPFLRCT